MAHFYEAMEDLLCRNMVDKAASMVEEKPQNIKRGISAILPSLLAMYLKTHDPNVNNILREAGNLDIIKDIDNICNETMNESQRRIGDNFLQEMLGDKAAEFTAPIAQEAGISNVAANRLIYMMAPVVAGYLGDKLVKDKWNEAKLLDEIRKSKDSFVKYIPAGIVRAFDLSYIIRTDTGETAEKDKKGMWLWWILAIVLVLLLLFFGWKSCKEKKAAEPVAVTQTIGAADKAASNTNYVDVTLPDGTVMNVYKNGIEDRMIKFLNSNEYKNATSDQLKEKWFEFKDVAFKFDSATELRPEAGKELDNIVAILKAYPDAKIRIAGFADKKGTEAVNLEISKERAISIEKILESKGIGSQIVKTEGFGEEYATHSVTETDEQRSEDRDMALRFVK